MVKQKEKVKLPVVSIARAAGQQNISEPLPVADNRNIAGKNKTDEYLCGKYGTNYLKNTV